MSILSKPMLAIGAAAMLATSSTPILAAYSVKELGASNGDVSVIQSYDGHRRRWRHRDRVDAGDILTGIGILAGIAILADAASDAGKNDRDDREPRYEDRDVDAPQPDINSDDLGMAVSACTDAAERAASGGQRVKEIRSVTRDGTGWRVEGELASEGFTCAATNGQVDYIRLEEREI
jgi:hypothetical protein